MKESLGLLFVCDRGTRTRKTQLLPPKEEEKRTETAQGTMRKMLPAFLVVGPYELHCSECQCNWFQDFTLRKEFKQARYFIT